MLFHGFILPWAFVTPADKSMGIKLRAEGFPKLLVIMLHPYRKSVEYIAIIIPTYHSQYRLST